MKRRNIYIASTLVLALVLMVGFPTSARPQVLKSFIKGVVKRLNSPAKTSAIALVGARKVDAYAKKRIEQQRRRAVRPVVIPPSVQAKLMLEQMKKLRASHNITAPRPKVKPVAQRKPHPQLPKIPRPKPVNAVKAARNKAANSNLKTVLKKTNAAIENNENKAEAVKVAVKAIDQACAKGLIHKNKAARKKSQIMRKANA